MTATDITAAEQIYRQALAALSEGIVVQDKDGAITSCNPAAERILGLSVDQMKGVKSTDPRWRAVHEDGSPFPGEEHPAMVTLRTGLPVEGVIMGVHKPDGSLSWISINVDAVPCGQRWCWRGRGRHHVHRYHRAPVRGGEAA